MKKYRAPAILMIIHGGLMELAGVVMLVITSILSNGGIDVNQYFSFRLQYLQDNIVMMTIMGVIFGVLRIIGAVGLLKNRMWGLALSIINSVVTMILMMFMLPAGIPDGLLAGSALVLMLLGYFGDKKIIENN